jgi:hypothetical protein
MNSVQNEFSVSKRRALTEMYDQILRFTPCRPPETRGDRHMLILLCDPLMNESWAEDTSSLRLMDGSTTLATTYVKLAAILTDKLQKDLRRIPSRTDRQQWRIMLASIKDWPILPGA